MDASWTVDAGGGPAIEVAVLGPVEIRGAVAPFSRRAAWELVVYLALHPRGASNEVWSAALWPSGVVAPSTVHSTVSVARRALGRAADGTDHLLRRDGRLRLGPGVGTDVDRFVRTVAAAGPGCGVEAMALVRGPVLDGLGMLDWAVLDGTVAELETMVVETALRGAAAALRAGRGHDAEWVIRRALRVSPYDERLYRGLLRAVDAEGNRLGLRRTMAGLQRLAATAGETSLHPQTMALYRELAQTSAHESGEDLVRR